jgi:hypothetical protein
MTARVAEDMRHHLNRIGAAAITDAELNAVIAMWFEVVTEDASDAELFKRLANVFDECAEAPKKQGEENIDSGLGVKHGFAKRIFVIRSDD